MRRLPPSETYDQVYQYMPWGKTIERVIEIIEEKAPQKGILLDMMCGTGHLLRSIRDRRPDLQLYGQDIDSNFIHYAAQKDKEGITYYTPGDVRLFKTLLHNKPDIITCTAGIHHLPYEDQEPYFLRDIPGLMKDDGIAIFADPFLSDYSNEQERQIAAEKLGHEYFLATVETNPPSSIIEEALDVMVADVKGEEWKTSVAKMQPVLENMFSDVTVEKTWPDQESEYGEYIFVCKN